MIVLIYFRWSLKSLKQSSNLYYYAEKPLIIISSFFIIFYSLSCSSACIMTLAGLNQRHEAKQLLFPVILLRYKESRTQISLCSITRFVQHCLVYSNWDRVAIHNTIRISRRWWYHCRELYSVLRPIHWISLKVMVSVVMEKIEVEPIYTYLAIVYSKKHMHADTNVNWEY